MTVCGKCGSTDNYSGCFLGEDFYVYEYGCEDCEHHVESEARATYEDAVKEARSMFQGKFFLADDA